MASNAKKTDKKKVPSASGGGALEKCRQALAEAQAKVGLLDLIPTPVMGIDRDFSVTYQPFQGITFRKLKTN